MNNTEKLENIKRALRRVETQLHIIQRTNVIMFERITGGAFPHSWVIRADEKAILSDSSESEPVTLDQLSTKLDEYIEASDEYLKTLTEWTARIEARLVTVESKTLTRC